MTKNNHWVACFLLLCSLSLASSWRLFAQSGSLRAADRLVVSLSLQPQEGKQKIYFSISEGDQVSLEAPSTGILTLGKKKDRQQAVSLELPSGVTQFSLGGSFTEFLIPYRAKGENTPKVAALDLQAAPRLLTLNCVGNDITSLNLSKSTNLAYLLCDANPIEQLELSGVPNLVLLSASDLKLKRLDLSANRKLIALGVGGNPFDKDFDLYAYSSLPLVQLSCDRLGLEEFDYTKFPNLQTLYIHGNKLKTMGDLRALRSLLQLSIGDNPFRDFDVNKLPNQQLRALYCFNLELSSLDLSRFTYLNKLDCSNNKLTHLSVHRCKNLEVLHCGRNALKELDLSALWLTELQCDRNQLSSLRLNNKAEMQYLSCYGNKLPLEGMAHLVEVLIGSTSQQSPRIFTPFTTRPEVPEHNVCPKNLVDRARAAGWQVRVVTGVDTQGGVITEDFEGSPSSIDTSLPQITLYPNPAKEYLWVENASPYAHLQLYNSVGECLLQCKANAQGQARLELLSLPGGAYYLFVNGVVLPCLITQ